MPSALGDSRGEPVKKQTQYLLGGIALGIGVVVYLIPGTKEKLTALLSKEHDKDDMAKG